MRKSMKTQRTTIKGRDDLEGVFGEYAAAVIERDALKAAMEERIRVIRTEYEAQFARIGEAADALLEDIEAWAAGHPEMFAEKKSMEMLHGTIGFRTGTPRVALPRGADEGELAIEMSEAGLVQYVRTHLELDKQRIIADCTRDEDGDENAAVLAAYGVKVKQSERFFAEVKRETGGEA